MQISLQQVSPNLECPGALVSTKHLTMSNVGRQVWLASLRCADDHGDRPPAGSKLSRPPCPDHRFKPVLHWRRVRTLRLSPPARHWLAGLFHSKLRFRQMASRGLVVYPMPKLRAPCDRLYYSSFAAPPFSPPFSPSMHFSSLRRLILGNASESRSRGSRSPRSAACQTS